MSVVRYRCRWSVLKKQKCMTWYFIQKSIQIWEMWQKWSKTKQKSKPKRQQINQKQYCWRLYTHHIIRSGVFKDFQSEPRKTPLTSDKERKWIPTCGEVELKRPSLIIANMRWWLHSACIHAHTQKDEWAPVEQKAANKKKKLKTATHAQIFQVWMTHPRHNIGFLSECNLRMPPSQHLTLPVFLATLRPKCMCHRFTYDLTQLPQSVLKCFLWSVVFFQGGVGGGGGCTNSCASIWKKLTA